MRIACEECKRVYNIPEDKWDDYNIYRKWDGIGSAAMCPPKLLCKKCTNHFIAEAEKKENDRRLQTTKA